MAVTFDGPNLRIILETAITEVNAKVDLYSEWKDWLKTPGNEVHLFAFSTEGGQPTTATGTVAPYYFLRNDLGWRIRPPEEDINITVVGNLYGTDPALPIIVPTTGAFTALVTVERDASSVVENLTGPAEMADAVWDEPTAGHLTAGTFGQFTQKKLLTVAKFLGLK